MSELLQLAFKVRDNTKMDTPQGAYDGISFDHAYKSFDLCLPIGVSYDFGRLSVELRSSPGLLKAVDKKDYTNVVGQLMVGYKFSVKYTYSNHLLILILHFLITGTPNEWRAFFLFWG